MAKIHLTDEAGLWTLCGHVVHEYRIIRQSALESTISPREATCKNCLKANDAEGHRQGYDVSHDHTAA